MSKIPPDELISLLPGGVRSQIDARAIADWSERSVTQADVLSSSQAGQVQWTDWKLETSTTDGLNSCVWVYACVYARAAAVASIPWMVMSGEEGSATKVPNHEAARILNNPNVDQTRQEFFQLVMFHLLLAGKTFISLVPGGGNPQELWAISPDIVGIKPSTTSGTVIGEFEVDPGGGGAKKIVAREDMIFIRYPDPTDPFQSSPPLQACGKEVDTDIQAATFQLNSLKNRMIADYALVSKRVMTEKQRVETRKRLDEFHKGTDKARTILLLSREFEVVKLSQSAVEMDFVGGRSLTRQAICSGLATPPVIVGIWDNATLANISEGRRIFWQDTIFPDLNFLGAAFNKGLASLLGENERLVPDIRKSPAWFEIFQNRIDAGFKLWMMGWTSNQINSELEFGMPEAPYGDTAFLPVNMTTADIITSGGNLTIDSSSPVETKEDKPGPSFKITDAA